MARPTSRSRTTETAAPDRAPRSYVGIAVAAVVVLAVVALIVFDRPPPGQAFDSLGNQHITDPSDPHVPYNSSPPSSGPHMGLLAEWRVHEDPVPPEFFVHNLEDGGIVLAYDCPEACPDLVEGLAGFVEGSVLLTPYEGITDPDGVPRRAAAVAWTRVFHFDELDEETASELGVFIDLYEGLDHHVGR